MRTTTKSLVVTAVVSLATLTAACGSSGSEGAVSGDASSTKPGGEAVNPAADLVGAGCADYTKAVPDGAGSIDGMAKDLVVTAASNNPMLKTFTKAVSGQVNADVDLVDLLDGGEYTVFAPVDDAFAKLPAGTLDTLAEEAGGTTLSGLLTHHVIPKRIAPADLDGTFTTLDGVDLTITGSGDDIRVGDRASVICGGVQTANATVYLVDTVLVPPAA
jgi:uncharacterized surface protein with fasciclin (FAS1) repeats